MADNAIDLRNLTRRFNVSGGDRLALDELSLQIESGEVHGLLGPNGAGKTTLCKILATTLLPSSGIARIEEYDVTKDARKVRTILGLCLGGERGLYTRLSAEQNLMYWFALYGVSRRQARVECKRLLERVGLASRTRDRVETFSRGMKQRLHLARALVGSPRILILDEPTAGMDPIAALDFRELISELKNESITILVTTHNMAEAEAVCDRVSLMDNGTILRTDNPRTIGQWRTSVQKIEAFDVPDDTLRQLTELEAVNIETEGSRTLVTVNRECDASKVLQVLANGETVRISAQSPSLEDIYIEMIGRKGMSAE